MAGSYCKFCDQRCFVLRRLPAGTALFGLRDVHLATCPEGKAHDRKMVGVDADSAARVPMGEFGRVYGGREPYRPIAQDY